MHNEGSPKKNFYNAIQWAARAEFTIAIYSH